MINIQWTFRGKRSGSRRNRNKMIKNGGGKGRERERATRRTKMSHPSLITNCLMKVNRTMILGALLFSQTEFEEQTSWTWLQHSVNSTSFSYLNWWRHLTFLLVIMHIIFITFHLSLFKLSSHGFNFLFSVFYFEQTIAKFLSSWRQRSPLFF